MQNDNSEVIGYHVSNKLRCHILGLENLSNTWVLLVKYLKQTWQVYLQFLLATLYVRSSVAKYTFVLTQNRTMLAAICSATVPALTFLRLWIQPTDLLIHNSSFQNIFGLLPITLFKEKSGVQGHSVVAEGLRLFISD